MELGAFSISLSVQDIQVSKEFYGKLGFEPVLGNPDENWLILRNGRHVVGLFQGMFERNTLTFNPGWDQQGRETETYVDVREIQRDLVASGIALVSEADETTEGPGACMIIDPDGNPILIDQHR
jgi:lactoylglutathione lyase